MLSESTKNFMSKLMKIDLKSIFDKFDENDVTSHRDEIESAIEVFVNAILEQDSSPGSDSYLLDEDSSAETTINQIAVNLIDKINSKEAKIVLDSLRHAFFSFAYGGLHQLFTRQENESWYPKIILDEVLEPNDIDVLPDIVVLYRGTDVEEFESRSYGQSWTTNREVADAFAYKHYVGQHWFERGERLVLCACIPKKHVYFSNQTGEFEVVVDTSMLNDVRKCT